jgi:hypothetical protein
MILSSSKSCCPQIVEKTFYTAGEERERRVCRSAGRQADEQTEGQIERLTDRQTDSSASFF